MSGADGKRLGGIKERYAAATQLLYRAPRTVKEILDLLGLPSYGKSSSYEAMQGHVNALVDEGLLKVVSERRYPDGADGHRGRVYGWIYQPPAERRQGDSY